MTNLEQAQTLYRRRYPDGDWTELAPAIQRVYLKAADEYTNPKLCLDCGQNADRHSGALGAHQFRTANAEKGKP